MDGNADKSFVGGNFKGTWNMMEHLITPPPDHQDLFIVWTMIISLWLGSIFYFLMKVVKSLI